MSLVLPIGASLESRSCAWQTQNASADKKSPVYPRGLKLILTDGTFQIKNLPPGEYTLVAVHEKFGEQTMKVKLGAKENAKADFSFSGGL